MPYTAASELTKKALCASLKKRMAAKPLNKISIREIVDACGLNRQTFYYHFKDIYDLLEWMFQEEAVSLIRKHDTFLDWQDGFLQLCEYLQANRAVCMCALESLGQPTVRRFIYRDLDDVTRKIIAELARGREVSESFVDFTARFYAIAFAGVLEGWLRGEIRETPAQMLAYLTLIISGNIEAGLEAYERATERGELL